MRRNSSRFVFLWFAWELEIGVFGDAAAVTVAQGGWIKFVLPVEKLAFDYFELAFPTVDSAIGPIDVGFAHEDFREGIELLCGLFYLHGIRN